MDQIIGSLAAALDAKLNFTNTISSARFLAVFTFLNDFTFTGKSHELSCPHDSLACGDLRADNNGLSVVHLDQTVEQLRNKQHLSVEHSAESF